jgi:hypothetical protein
MYRPCLSLLFCISLVLTSILPPAYSQVWMGRDLAPLPEPGKMVALSSAVNPPVLRGIKVYTNDPLKFDFILDPGDSGPKADLKKISTRLLKYFLATLTVPEDDIWVNLSPYEKNRIIPDSFGQTEMGRDLLGQDYLLKQITASLMFPQGESGKKFWARVYEEARKKFGSTNIPVNTFNKVWIMPEKAVVYEKMADSQATAFVIESRLKVMLESDYIALKGHEAAAVGAVQKKPLTDTQKLSEDITREVIIPILDKEVNTGANFAPLRQVYNSVLLALWYKDRMKSSILSLAYTNRNKIAGVNVKDRAAAEKIWQQYVKAYKKGVFNLIREDKDVATNEIIPRKYFSGGITIRGDAPIKYSSAAMTSQTAPMFLNRRNLMKLITVGLNIIGAPAAAQPPTTPIVEVKPNRADRPLFVIPDLPTITIPFNAPSSSSPYASYNFIISAAHGVLTVHISYAGAEGSTTLSLYPNGNIVSSVFGISIPPYVPNTPIWQNTLLAIIQTLQQVEFLSPENSGALDAMINIIQHGMPSIVNVPWIGTVQDGFLMTLTNNYDPGTRQTALGNNFQVNNTYLNPITGQLETNSINVDLQTGEISVYDTANGPQYSFYGPNSAGWKENLQELLQTLQVLGQLPSVNAGDFNEFVQIFSGWSKNGFFSSNILIYPNGAPYSWSPTLAFINAQLNLYANSTISLERSYYRILREAKANILASNRQAADSWREVYGMAYLLGKLQNKYPTQWQQLELVGRPAQETPSNVSISDSISGVKFKVTGPLEPALSQTEYYFLSLAPLFPSNQRYGIMVDASDTNTFDRIDLLLNRFVEIWNALGHPEQLPFIPVNMQDIIIELQNLSSGNQPLRPPIRRWLSPLKAPLSPQGPSMFRISPQLKKMIEGTAQGNAAMHTGTPMEFGRMDFIKMLLALGASDLKGQDVPDIKINARDNKKEWDQVQELIKDALDYPLIKQNKSYQEAVKAFQSYSQKNLFLVKDKKYGNFNFEPGKIGVGINLGLVNSLLAHPDPIYKELAFSILIKEGETALHYDSNSEIFQRWHKLSDRSKGLTGDDLLKYIALNVELEAIGFRRALDFLFRANPGRNLVRDMVSMSGAMSKSTLAQDQKLVAPFLLSTAVSLRAFSSMPAYKGEVAFKVDIYMRTVAGGLDLGVRQRFERYMDQTFGAGTMRSIDGEPFLNNATSLEQFKFLVNPKYFLNQAMRTDASLGGIDLTSNVLPLQVQNAGARIKFYIDPAMLQQLQNASGIVPVVINIQPLRDLKGFLMAKAPNP